MSTSSSHPSSVGLSRLKSGIVMPLCSGSLLRQEPSAFHHISPNWRWLAGQAPVLVSGVRALSEFHIVWSALHETVAQARPLNWPSGPTAPSSSRNFPGHHSWVLVDLFQGLPHCALAVGRGTGPLVPASVTSSSLCSSKLKTTTFAKHWTATSLTILSSTSRHLRPIQQYVAKLSFARGRLCRDHWTSRIESFFGDLSSGEPPALLREIEADNAALRGESFSSVAAHVVLHTSYIHDAGQGTTGSLECACASSLQHSALSPCSKRSTGMEQSSPGRLGFHSPLHRYPLPPGMALQPSCKSAARNGTRPSELLGPLTCVSQVLRQCGDRYWQQKQSQLF